MEVNCINSDLGIDAVPTERGTTNLHRVINFECVPFPDLDKFGLALKPLSVVFRLN